jgi:hypothetical protein
MPPIRLEQLKTNNPYYHSNINTYNDQTRRQRWVLLPLIFCTVNLFTAFIITGGCGSIGGTAAKMILNRGGIALVSYKTGNLRARVHCTDFRCPACRGRRSQSQDVPPSRTRVLLPDGHCRPREVQRVDSSGLEGYPERIPMGRSALRCNRPWPSVEQQGR